MVSELLAAFGLVLVLEGILPFASPRAYRSAAAQMALSSDTMLRSAGLGFMVLGAVIVAVAR